ncbi:MAG: DNA polymerase Y family protein [Devosia sp.]
MPYWETDCLKRADPALAALTCPFALWEKQQSAMRLVALDPRAISAGLFVGQSLSDARAICTDLDVREIDRFYLEGVFADFADWHSNASPIVSILTDKAPWGDLILDITGVSGLFGGETEMLRTMTERLAHLGFTVRAAIAPTVGAAWALAHHSSQKIVETDIRSALEPLPVAALRLDEDQLAGLNHLGLKRIGQITMRDRRSLQARFGATLLLRLDQALGHIEERITPRLPIADRFAERRFADPIGLMDDVLMTARDLAFRLTSQLEREGIGAQAFHLFLYRVDHKVMTLSVNAARATRDPNHIARLFANHAERLEGDYDAGFGIDMIRLAASSVSPLSESHIGIFDVQDGTASLDQLYDRMVSKLGPLSIARTKFVNTHIPERAVKLEPVIARTVDDTDAMPDSRLKRPLRLLPKPEPIAVLFAEVPDGPPPGMVWRRVGYKFIKASGPERIGVEWWTLSDTMVSLPKPETEPQAEQEGTQKHKDGDDEGRSAEYTINDGLALTRDYYVAEDESGRRFWLFREGLYVRGMEQRWYMHGFFA